MSFFDVARFGTPLNTEIRSCYIGLGSNLDKPIYQVMTALQELDKIPNSKITAISSIYRSKPVGPEDQPHFINAVAKLSTLHPPEVLLTILQQHEETQGRVRHPRQKRWGPRVIDLDMLLYEQEIIETESLSLPHPEIANRSFVVVPLYELDPELIIPGEPEQPIKPLYEKFREDPDLQRIMITQFNPKTKEDEEEEPIDHHSE